MDLADGAHALARSEQRVLFARFCRPAEAALALGVLMTHIFCRAGHLNEFLELFLVRIGKDAV